MTDELIGKFIRDAETGDIGKIIELRQGRWGRKSYYLIKWVHLEEGSWHKRGTQTHKNVVNEYYAQYTPENISKPDGRFEILTGIEALVYVI